MTGIYPQYGNDLIQIGQSREPQKKVRKPPWLKISLRTEPVFQDIRTYLRRKRLHTVCEEAHCPNMNECWNSGTATFMVMGDTCTRGCRFCAVKTAKQGLPLDPHEPENVAKGVARFGLDYVVLTSVDRDDLPDGGAQHFADCVRAIKKETPDVHVETLIPDFAGDYDALQTLVEAKPDVIAHNIETVPRLQQPVRDPRADYSTSLHVLRRVKKMDPTRYTKSSIMIGFGEQQAEVLAAMDDLRAINVDVLTVGQYLQPSVRHITLQEYVHPDAFEAYKKAGMEKGFLYVASGPLVRSSYKAGEFFMKGILKNKTKTEKEAV